MSRDDWWLRAGSADHKSLGVSVTRFDDGDTMLMFAGNHEKAVVLNEAEFAALLEGIKLATGEGA